MRINSSAVTLLFIVFISSSAFAEKAPPITLETHHGTFSLDSLRGRAVYLDFWASWCEPCRKSFPWMNELQNKYASQGLSVVAVNLDSKQANADKFLAAHPVNFKIVFDPMGSSAKSYKVKGMPSSYLIDREGNIVSSHIGFQEKETAMIEKEIVDLLGQ